MIVAFYDTKNYDRKYFNAAVDSDNIDFRFFEMRLDPHVVSSVAEAEAVCVFVNDRLDRKCLEGISERGVKIVALRCAGFNNLDLKAAADLGLRVVRVPAYSPHAVAEHTVALFLTLNRRIHRAFNRVREHNFSLNGLVGFDLAGKTVGIAGSGKIGKLTAQIFRGFGCEVLAWDKYPDYEWAKENKVKYIDFTDLLERVDVLSLHTPLTPDTHHLINAATIKRMKDGVFLVNTSRGKLINHQALIEGLKRGKFSGVALDVYEEEEGVFFEDLSDEIIWDETLARLLTFPNVLITSHQGFLTHEALTEIARVSVTNLINFENGKPFLEGTEIVFKG
jgi:D-lactate dehydrogenase